MLGSSLAPGSYEDVQTLTLWHSISPDLSGVRSSSARRSKPVHRRVPLVRVQSQADHDRQ